MLWRTLCYVWSLSQILQLIFQFYTKQQPILTQSKGVVEAYRQRDKELTHLCRFAVVAKVLYRNKLIDHNLLDSSFTLLKRVKPSRRNKQAASGSKGRRKRSTDVGETDDDAPPNVDDYLPGLDTNHFLLFPFLYKIIDLPRYF